jgi:hypothetical protein
MATDPNPMAGQPGQPVGQQMPGQSAGKPAPAEPTVPRHLAAGGDQLYQLHKMVTELIAENAMLKAELEASAEEGPDKVTKELLQKVDELAKENQQLKEQKQKADEEKAKAAAEKAKAA